MKKKLITTFLVSAFFAILPLTGNAAATFSGHVTYDDDGAPVQDAWVKFFSFNTAQGDQDITDSEGYYSFTVDEIEAGEMVYHGIEPAAFWQSDWSALGYNQTWMVSDEGTLEVDFIVTRTNASLSGTVLSPPGEEERFTGAIWLINDDHTFWTMNFGNDDWVDTFGGDYWSNCKSGAYTLYFFPDLGMNPDWSQYYFTSQIIVIEEGENTFDIQMGAKTAMVDATVTLDGAPAQGISVMAIKDDERVEGITNELGETTLKLAPDQEYEILPVNSGNLIYNGASELVTTIDQDTVEVAFSMVAPDVQVNVIVNDTMDHLLEYDGTAWCEGKDGASYSAPIGDGVATIQAVADEQSGEFDAKCYIAMEDEEIGAALAIETEVAADGEAELTFPILTETAELNIAIQDPDGEVVTGSTGGVLNLWSEELGKWYEASIGASGEVSIDVIPGTYAVGVSYNDDFIGVRNENLETVTVTDGETAETEVVVEELSEVVSGTVLDEEGDPATYGTVYCDNWSAEQDDGYVASASITDGEFELKVPAGYEYNCGVSISADKIENGITAPVEQGVDLTTSTGQDAELDFQLKEADEAIDIDLTIGDDIEGVESLDDFDNIWCYAWSDEGGYAYSDYEEGETEDLNIDSERDWDIACDAQKEKEWYSTSYKSYYVGEETEQELELQAIAEKAMHESYSGTFDMTSGANWSFDDGTSLGMKKEAFGSGGTVTVNVFQERDVVYTGDIPVTAAWNFEAYDSDGSIITNLKEDVNISMPYNEDYLAELGITEEDITPKYFDPITNSWKEVTEATIDTDENVVTIATDHFTQFALTYNSAAVEADKEITLPKKVKNFKFKKSLRKKKQVRATWTKRKNATGYVIKLQKWNKKQKKYKKYRTIRIKKNLKKKVIKKLKPGLKYRGRIRAYIKSDGQSYYGLYTKWMKFKTKS